LTTRYPVGCPTPNTFMENTGMRLRLIGTAAVAALSAALVASPALAHPHYKGHRHSTSTEALERQKTAALNNYQLANPGKTDWVTAPGVASPANPSPAQLNSQSAPTGASEGKDAPSSNEPPKTPQ
jgi:hypothetical protein